MTLKKGREKMMNFILGFLCGILFSIGVIFFFRWLSSTIHKMDYI